MSRRSDKSLIVGLDIGTSKVTALVGEYSLDSDEIEVIGLGTHDSRGMRRGVVVDIESTVESIRGAIEEAEVMAGCEIRSVYAAISGSHTECRRSSGISPVVGGEVHYHDLEQALQAAKVVAISSDQRIIHAIPQEYILDNFQEGVRNPVGMSAVRLELHALLITAATSAASNIEKCISRCGLQVDGLVLSSLASSHAVLSMDEKESGVVLVDMGAGTTDIAVYAGGYIRHAASLPIGGDQVTNDIAHILRTSTPDAEQLKIRYACALAQLTRADESIQVPGVGGRAPRRLARQSLAEAVQSRYEEIFELVHAELRRSGFEEFVRAGMVLTGGAARMEGVVELAEEILHMPVREGIPQNIQGLGEVVGNPTYATAVGLMQWGRMSDNPRRPGFRSPNAASGWFGKISKFIKGEL
ncbi:cell division protein FtsA [Arenimonas sp.]|jgi:cell division protein FtsA|uniref:cell division protein FtsA n=1 Tax=Arenimonas sp. TaxID=1872635 RepID=UPI0037C06AFB